MASITLTATTDGRSVNSKMSITDNRRCNQSELTVLMGSGEKGRNDVGDEGNIDPKDVQ